MGSPTWHHQTWFRAVNNRLGMKSNGNIRLGLEAPDVEILKGSGLDERVGRHCGHDSYSTVGAELSRILLTQCRHRMRGGNLTKCSMFLPPNP